MSTLSLQQQQLISNSIQLIQSAFERYPADNIAISFSGAEDVILIDLMSQLQQRCEVFSLDTGRLHPQTYRFIETVRNHYDLPINIVMPDSNDVAELVQQKGLFSFRNDGHEECCAARKINPLRSKLAQLDAWITGQRIDQSVTRTELAEVHMDGVFDGRNGALEKFNPLANWRSADVWDYIRDRQVPYNPLHEQGYVSIGCEPCTRAVAPHEHERAGRWWWESATHKECGLHRQNLIAHG